MALLCSGLGIAWGLSGCGDDDDDGCEALCNKVIECAEEVGAPVDMTAQECIDGCRDASGEELDCAFACDADATCIDWATCIVEECDIEF